MTKILDALSNMGPMAWWLVLLVATGLVTGFVTGYFRARKIQPGAFKWSIFRREVMWATANLTVTTLTLGAITAFLTSIGWITFSTQPASWWIIAAEYTLYFFGFDTWFYWWHRAMHIEPWYRLSHKVHHGSISPNPVTSLSMNPIEGVIEGLWLPVLTAAVTLHKETMVFVIPTAVIMGQYVHSGFEFLPRWWNRSWLTKWFITATFHDEHHRYFKGNYGGFTTIWDYICGTVRPKYETNFEKITTRPIRSRAGRAVVDSAA